jgi:TP901 family phage tail tape measure protein
VPDAIGVASIEIVPDTTAFLPRTQAQVSSALAKVQADVVVNAVVNPATTGASTVERSLKEQVAGTSLAQAAANDLKQSIAELQAVESEAIQISDADAKAKLRAAKAADVDAEAEKALASITSTTSKETIAQIDVLTAQAAALKRSAAAQADAAEASLIARAASTDTTKGIAAQTLALTGFSGELTAAAIAGFVLFQSLQQRSDFEDKMHVAEAATHATAEEMKGAEKAAIDLGRSLDIPGASANEAADAIAELTHKGFDLVTSEKLARNALLESAAANEDVGTAVGQVTDLVLGYKLAIDQASDATDALTSAEVAGVGSTTQVEQALSDLSVSATGLGLGIRDVSALLIELGNDGVAAGDASSQLRAIFSALAKDSDSTEKGLKKIHLSFQDLFDDQGKLRPDAFVILGEAISKLNRIEQRRVETLLVGFRGQRALDDLVRQGLPGYDAAAERARELGSTQEEAETQARGLGGQIRELQSNVADLGLVIGQITEPAALLLFRSLNILVRAFENEVFAVDAFVKKMIGARGEIEKLAAEAAKGIHLKFIVGAVEGIGKAIEDAIKKVPGEKFGEKIGHDIAAGIKDALGGGGGGGVDIKKALETGFALATPVGPLELAIVKELTRTKDEAGAATEAMADENKRNLDRISFDWADLVDKVTQSARELVANARGASVALSHAEQLGILQATGADLPAQLAEARAEQAAAGAHLARERRIGTRKAIDNAVAAKKQADADVASILGQMESNSQKAAADAKKKSDKIVQARVAAQQAVIDSISSEATRREAAVTHAATTAGLGDDLKTENALRNFYRRSIDRIKREIAAAKKAGDDLGALKTELQSLRISKQAVRDEITRLHQQQAQDAAQTAVESAQLDEQILETKIGDTPTEKQKAALIRAHERVIAVLRDEIHRTHARGIELKKLQLEIAQEQADIDKLRKTKADEKRSAQELATQEFEFLQTISGFSANLLGNLIPGGLTSGLVGGSAPPADTSSSSTFGSGAGGGSIIGGPEFSPAVGGNFGLGASSRTKPSGTPFAATQQNPTRGGQNRQTQLLVEIRNLLMHIYHGTGHPEAQHRRRATYTDMDLSNNI